MPGWHARTKDDVAAGRVQVLGLIQEQHAERALLFMQWQQMGWPLLVDSLNLLGVKGIPLTYLLDEAGTIRYVNPRPADYQDFLSLDPVESSAVTWTRPKRASLLAEPGLTRAQQANRRFLWGDGDGLSRAIDEYRSLLSESAAGAKMHFRLGVALRRRYDSSKRLPDDFSQAVAHWGTALDLDPNQYIWRRRIQQYGPRLSKPYSFYDWVHEARKTVSDRGETPITLTVEPGGAEFARPSREFVESLAEEKNPDAAGRIFRDRKALIQMETVVVPAVVRAGEAVRLHLLMRPDVARQVHWNNEVEELVVWVDGADGWQSNQQLHRHSLPERPVTIEPRKLEFELRSAVNVRPGLHQIRGYALYHICEDVNGQCLYRRQDFSVPVTVAD